MQVIRLGNQSFSPLDENPAVPRQLHLAAIAIEQADAGLLFQRLDAARQGGLGQAEFLGGLSIAEFARQHDDMPQVAQFHLASHA